MLRFVWNKIWYKKWMNLCILIATILLIGVAVSNPMYQNAAMYKLLQGKLENYSEQDKRDAGLVSIQVDYAKGSENAIDESTHNTLYASLEEMVPNIKKRVGVPIRMEVEHRRTAPSFADLEFERAANDTAHVISIGTLTDLEQHVEIEKGICYAEEDTVGEGPINVIVSRSVLDDLDLVVNEVITFRDYTYKNGSKVSFRVCGVFKEKDRGDNYWVHSASEYEKEIFMSGKTYDKLQDLILETGFQLTYEHYLFMNYPSIQVQDVPDLNRQMKYLMQCNSVGGHFNIEFQMREAINAYNQETGRVSFTMLNLQLPVLVLLLAFIIMTSNQVMETEQNEISILISRGASRAKVFLIFLLQSAILSFVGLVIGFLVGIGLCRLIGSTNAFMEFSIKSSLRIPFSGQILIIALLAYIICVACITLPVIRYSKVSIVQKKRKSHRSLQPFWQRYWMDMIILVVACYLAYSFYGQRNAISQKVISGKNLDVLFYLDSSIFILGAALFLYRLSRLILRLVYWLGRHLWGPAQYTAFLSVIRSNRKLWFMSVFLMLTLAMGIYNSNCARTINETEELRTRYDNGADVVLEETWKDNHASVDRNPDLPYIYTEPDFNRYEELAKGVESLTRVETDMDVEIGYGAKQSEDAIVDGHYMSSSELNFHGMLMAIESKEFGETAWMRSDVLEQDFYEYLNLLAAEPDGVLVSTNLLKDLKAKVGDNISYTRYDIKGRNIGKTSAIIVGAVDAWPTYQNKRLEVNQYGGKKSKNAYLIVANYAKVASTYGAMPYDIWIHTKGTTDKRFGSTKPVYDFIAEYKIPVNSLMDTSQKLLEKKSEPFLQVTNGFLTISFIVVLILCAVGFLIYWVISIRQRELLFGVYRAMGMNMRGVLTILLWEHLFTSFFAIAGGIVIGAVATKVFIPLQMLSYAPEKHTLPLELVVAPSDMMRLGISVLAMLVICFAVLGTLVRRLKITQVLKLGED